MRLCTVLLLLAATLTAARPQGFCDFYRTLTGNPPAVVIAAAIAHQCGD